MKILMVCLGNICRSPIAEGIMRHKIQQHGLDWEVSSCGTGDWHSGEAPHPGARRMMQSKHIDISKQRAKQFHYTFFEEYDRIYAMDISNYRDLMMQAESEAERQKVQLIMQLVHPDENVSVPDPYYDEAMYEVVFSMLDAACDKIIELYSQ